MADYIEVKSGMVYLVQDGAVQTVAVFSTAAKAQEWIAAQPDRHGAHGPHRPVYEVEEVEVDAVNG